MALNVKGLVAQAFKTAQALVPDAMPAVQIRLGPNSVTDPVTEQSVTTWQVEKQINPVAYKAKSERDKFPAEVNVKSFAFQISEFPAGTDIDQKGEIIEDGLTWQVYTAEKDPTGSLAIFHAKR